MENGDIITNPSTCADVLNNFFSDSVNDLDVDRSLHVDTVSNADDSIDNAIKIYNNHPNVISINKLTFSKNSFSFHPTSKEHVHTAISNIDASKSYQKDNIPPKMLEANVAVCKVFLNSDINNCIKISIKISIKLEEC